MTTSPAMISKNCPDKRLVMSLANSMEPIGMLSQQLNIIASVKASATGKYSEFINRFKPGAVTYRCFMQLRGLHWPS